MPVATLPVAIEAPRRRRRSPAARAEESAAAALDDAALVERARRGERAAFEMLVVRYKDRIYHLCFSKLGSVEDALDATQEVFLRAYRAIGRFEGKSAFYTWLFRIALNCAFTQRKRRHASERLAGSSLDQVHGRGAGDADDPFEPADPGDGPGRAALRAEQLAVIHAAIRELPDAFQEIVLLRDIEDLAYEEIAEILGVPIGSVKSRLHRARLQLRARLDGYLQDE